jgi:hypothetical protein
MVTSLAVMLYGYSGLKNKGFVRYKDVSATVFKSNLKSSHYSYMYNTILSFCTLYGSSHLVVMNRSRIWQH